MFCVICYFSIIGNSISFCYIRFSRDSTHSRCVIFPSWLWVRYHHRLVSFRCTATNLGLNTWRRKWQPTPVSLPGKPHGQRSLESYSPFSDGINKSLYTPKMTGFVCMISLVMYIHHVSCTYVSIHM